MLRGGSLTLRCPIAGCCASRVLGGIDPGTITSFKVGQAPFLKTNWQQCSDHNSWMPWCIIWLCPKVNNLVISSEQHFVHKLQLSQNSDLSLATTRLLRPEVLLWWWSPPQQSKLWARTLRESFAQRDWIHTPEATTTRTFLVHPCSFYKRGVLYVPVISNFINVVLAQQGSLHFSVL